MLINLRNALMTGKRLPYDAELEYIESTGTQWIDTGFSPGSSFEVFADINTEMTSAERDLMGNLTSFSRGNFVIGVYNNFVFVYINGSTRLDSNSLGTGRKDIAIAYKQDATSRLLTVNGVDYTNTSLVEVINSPIYLFTNGPDLNRNSSMRLRNFKGWNDGVLVRDYIPVRVGTVGYLYDRVSGKLFGNAGTGDFVVGQDVVPVEWLDFTGTQCLDLGFKPTQATTTSIDIVPAVTGMSNIGWISAGNGSGVKYESYGWSNRAQVYYGNESDTNWSVYAGDHIKIELGKNTKYENITQGTTYSKTFTDTTFTAAYNLTIGALNRGGYSYNAKMRLYSATVAGDKSLRLLPVRVGTEGAMMDVLTRRIYRNAGTGAFTYGNDLKYPIPSE